MPRKKKSTDQRIRERRKLAKEEKNDPKPSTNNQLRSTDCDKTFELSKPGVASKTKDAPELSANVKDDLKCEHGEKWKNDTSKPSSSQSTDNAKTLYSVPPASFKKNIKMKLKKNNMLLLKEK